MGEQSKTGPSWDRSARGWIASIEGGELNRVWLLDEPMLRLAEGPAGWGGVRRKDVIDIGCGEGRFCRLLQERGARTVGVDPTRALLKSAREKDPRGTYLEGVAEKLPVADASFDLTVFYLSLIDIPDYRAAIAEAARVLRPGGRVIIANLNPFCTTRPIAWYRNERGEKLHVAVEEYFTERGYRTQWGSIDIMNYHRPLANYLTTFLQAGFELEAYEEPRASEEAVRRHPRMMDERIVPLFHVYAWRKKG